MSSSNGLAHDVVEEGQFDDAPDDKPGAPTAETGSTPLNPREGHAYIDDEEALLAWSQSEDEDEERDAFEEEEDELEASVFQTLRAEDEDWEIAERDFTKQYNRLKQHVAVRTGSAQGVASAINSRATVAALPAVNRPRLTAKAAPSAVSTSNASVPRAKDQTADQLQALSKYSSRIRDIDMPYDLGVGVNRKGPSATANMKDKSDRATSEQVLDPRTRIILFKMIGRGLVFEVNGCVSTGKEANVYHALTPDRKHLALKIYKTSILVFKDRDKYVTGEFRFRRGYSRHNPRKMVRLWAEKEVRNLKRLVVAGILCPEPIEVRENVLVMSFIGDKEGWASPRLKDADIPESAYPDLYVELLCMTRKMFLICKLVHADLSEYNVLYHIEDSPPPSSPPQSDAASPTEQRGHLYIIDVSQSVEHDHPHAFDFLRADLRNIEDFFGKRGVRTIGLRRAFDYVTREVLPGSADQEETAVLRLWMEEPEPEPAADVDREMSALSDAKAVADAAHEDSVFLRSYIPRTLNEVYDPERDVDVLTRGEGAKLIYKDTIGIVGPKNEPKSALKLVEGGDVVVVQNHKANGVRFKEHDDADEGRVNALEAQEVGSEVDGEGSSSDAEDESSGAEEVSFEEKQPRGHRHEDKEAKKERKKAVKVEARERRKHKIPKAEKNRKIKATARGG
ncbi:RIO1-domain-containing protein [Laetiporus sulphureus 93-53]|uniref:Serine/threonine-protein kinase RIO1 n=1 Tax=Laetiporus sulphureus 93-53 TaxID=1314785 RepID=A0A165FKP6_9APHY|nr:RIO1-domain-containing protein [Laetiporus sulphureus 93-53]KZT09117.1 RIO1-domain-containing protein [Laetiporus sulphureus 93-53]